MGRRGESRWGENRWGENRWGENTRGESRPGESTTVSDVEERGGGSRWKRVDGGAELERWNKKWSVGRRWREKKMMNKVT